MKSFIPLTVLNLMRYSKRDCELGEGAPSFI